MKAWLALLALTVLVGCGGRITPPPGPGSDAGRAVIPDTTKVLDEAALLALNSVSPEGRFTFTTMTPVLQDLTLGDVIIVGVSNLTPYGALRKVEGMMPQGAGLVLETRPALLEEAFEDLELQLETTLRPPEPMVQQAGLTFPLTISASEANGRADLRGSLSLAPSFSLTLDIDIAGFSLKELSMNFGAKETFLATLTGQGRASFNESLTLGTIYFTPIILTLPSPSGLVPVVLTPQVAIEAGLQGSINGSFAASVTQEASFTAGVGYQNGDFGGFSDSDSNFTFEQPLYDAAASVKALAGPRLEVMLYGAVGPFASAAAYVELSASAEGPPPCARGVVNAGITAKAGVDFLADYETTLFNEVFPLASFDSCTTDPNAPRPAITWSRSFSRVGSVGERARAVVEADDGTYLVVGDSSLFGGVTGTGASLWAMRLDALGNIMWQKAFGRRIAQGMARAVQEVPGGFVIASAQGIMKLDPGGNLLWVRSYEGEGGVDIFSMETHADGSMIVAGRYGIPTQAWAMKLDADGRVLWSRRFGGDSFSRVRLTSDGGYILVGLTPTRANDVFLVKLDGNGNVNWQRALNNPWDRSGGELPNPTILDSTDQGMDVAEKPGGGYVVVGETYGAFPIPEPYQAGHYASWVAEVGADGHFAEDDEGNAIGSTVYRVPGDSNYSSAYAVVMRPNGSTVVVGRRADTSGDLLKNEDVLVIQGGAFSVLGGGGNDSVYGGLLGGGIGSMPIGLTQDGGLILAATSDSFAGKEQVWLVKLGRTANINFPYLTNISGEFFNNDHSVSLDIPPVATSAPITVSDRTTDVEITQVESLKQAP